MGLQDSSKPSLAHSISCENELIQGLKTFRVRQLRAQRGRRKREGTPHVPRLSASCIHLAQLTGTPPGSPFSGNTASWPWIYCCPDLLPTGVPGSLHPYITHLQGLWSPCGLCPGAWMGAESQPTGKSRGCDPGVTSPIMSPQCSQVDN